MRKEEKVEKRDRNLGKGRAIDDQFLSRLNLVQEEWHFITFRVVKIHTISQGKQLTQFRE